MGAFSLIVVINLLNRLRLMDDKNLKEITLLFRNYFGDEKRNSYDSTNADINKPTTSVKKEESAGDPASSSGPSTRSHSPLRLLDKSLESKRACRASTASENLTVSIKQELSESFNQLNRMDNSAPSASKCSTPTKAIKAADDQFRCEWDRCFFASDEINSFFDHVNDKHVHAQRLKSACTSPSKQTQMKSRRKVTRFRCKWKHCRMYDSEFPSIERLEKHVRVSHTKEKAFRCRLQGCVFQSNKLDELIRHMENHDKVESKPNIAGKIEGSVKNQQSNPLKRQASSSSSVACSSVVSSASVGRSSRKISAIPVSTIPAKYPPPKVATISTSEAGSENSESNFGSFDSLKQLEFCKLNTARFKLSLKNTMNGISSFINFDPNKLTDSLTLYGKVIGSRTYHEMAPDLNRIEKRQLLVRWPPAGICSDEWLEPSESISSLVREVQLSKVPRQFWVEKSNELNNCSKRLSKSGRKQVPKKLVLC